ncbi:hypothetical protein, partial [Sphingomonas sp.]|uniref:hypothetical protein n=1 Tax=Sphingomonas sp. TaxID=28214 RepID=UPI00257EEF58
PGKRRPFARRRQLKINRENAIVPVTMLALPSIYTPTRLTKDMRLDNLPFRISSKVGASRAWLQEYSGQDVIFPNAIYNGSLRPAKNPRWVTQR